MEALYNIDVAIFLFFNAYLIHPILDYVMPRITHLSFWVIPGILGAGLFVWRTKNRKKALIVLGLMLLTVAISDPVSSQILKKLFARPRPCHPDFLVEGGRFILLGALKTGFTSFPSSHAMNMFSIATLYTCFYPKRWMYFMAFAALIGYTRVYIGVHYPFDILAGAVFGAALGWGVYRGYVFTRAKFFKK
jgi:undecaprenyl-diphosphatase